MRFMVILKSDPATESTAVPTTEMLEAMGAYNQQLVDAGVMIGGEGLHPSSSGARVIHTPGQGLSVVDGPFAESKELIAGFWIFQVDSLQEAIDWVKRVPLDPGEESQIEIRRVFEMEDFGEQLTPELREQEDRQRAQVSEQHGG